MFKGTTIIVAAISAGLLSATAQANWTLNQEESSIYFATVKNATTSEVHQFKMLGGEITEGGKASLVIKLASVDTANPIRDERMQKQLFETDKYPDATVSVDLGSEGVKVGSQMLTATLNLHGVDKEISTQVFVEQDGKSIKVSSLAPLVISAPDFSLDKGIEALRSLAALTSINLTVPVTFRLVYDMQK
ncbi:YceI family protein [Leucothrix pacifica]|nr:YceI family protein [Leucothrix pacifica]